MTRMQLHINCVRASGNDILAMTDDAQEISLDTFKRRCDWRSLAQALGYVTGRGRGLRIEKDYAVSAWRSRYRGKPCYYLVQSCIEYVFLAPMASATGRASPVVVGARPWQGFP